MNFIDELYQLYRDKLTGDDEDIDVLALAVLEQLDRNDVLQLISELEDRELYNLMGLYLTDSLKRRFANDTFDHDPSKFLH
ncbi:hypothetical protein AC622_03540 [Bacillus sp. FJAT-27916]|uniref:DUF6154 family protein n=1 Tax=Bacillus sp. FJAT-27916 TaxID=1679169 RepID=UPI00067154F4|nr:DUF6154 family protein [Bacillus sp. FJAT-27916]KMY43415.1 hypothetical protein AC622_03540 [Bacillus sp. FJAT-27916]